ncbi:MAG: YbaK/EbsC family protein [Deinococcus sp.]|nr:YbaK/EbsC family protein [Deinococcus sp.]
MAQEATEQVRRYLKEQGVEVEIRQFPQGTQTAQQAAAALGTQVACIVKSLVFAADGQPVLVLCSGDRRVDVAKLARLCGAQAVAQADARLAKEWTGYAIGGVPPVAHPRRLRTFIDQHLLDHPQVFAAAGTGTAVFGIASRTLAQVTGGELADVTEEERSS